MTKHLLLPLLILPIAVGCGGRLAPEPAQDAPAASSDGQPSPHPTPAHSPPGPDAAAPETGATPAAPGTIWTSDDGPILGLAVEGDRVFAVTQSKLTSVARDGGDARVLAQSPSRYAYGGAVEVRAGTIFFGTTGSVSRIPRDGGALTLVGAEGYATVGIALDGADVYWMTDDAVMRAPQTGGAATKLATLAGVSYENAFALVGTDLYWSTNAAANTNETAALFRLSGGRGAPEVIAPGPVFSVEPNPRGGVAWLEDPAPVIVSHTTGAADTRVALAGWVNEFATDGARWYWRDEGTGVLYAMGGADGAPRALTAPEPAATANDGMGRHTIVDAQGIVWASRTGPIRYQPDVDTIRAIPLPAR